MDQNQNDERTIERIKTGSIYMLHDKYYLRSIIRS